MSEIHIEKHRESQRKESSEIKLRDHFSKENIGLQEL